ncbi:MAG: transposase [Betaproteobacteria bacterium]|nr:transposase [Betaproteobacteria bacterium]
MANAICERMIGTIRRECLDGLISVSESHPRSILKEWMTYYNRARPHLTGYTIRVVPAPQSDRMQRQVAKTGFQRED